VLLARREQHDHEQTVVLATKVHQGVLANWQVKRTSIRQTACRNECIVWVGQDEHWMPEEARNLV